MGGCGEARKDVVRNGRCGRECRIRGLPACRSQTAVFHKIRDQEVVMLKTKDLRDLSAEELMTKEGEFNQELFNLKIQKATGQLGNTAII